MRLTTLDTELRKDWPWLKVVGLAEVDTAIHPGDTWKRRGLEYAAPGPLNVTWHHTAASIGQINILRFELYKYDSAPGNNVNIAPDGTVYILAAGSCYTNGVVVQRQFSRGMGGKNSNSFTMEIHNPGNGSRSYPRGQVDACFAVTITVNRLSRNQPTDLATHHELAPARKTDPGPASSVEGPWRPRPCTASGTWHGDDIRSEVKRRASGTAPTPTPDPIAPGGDEVRPWFVKGKNTPYVYLTNMVSKVWLVDENALATAQYIMGTKEIKIVDDMQLRGCGAIDGWVPPGRDIYGAPL